MAVTERPPFTPIRYLSPDPAGGGMTESPQDVERRQELAGFLHQFGDETLPQLIFPVKGTVIIEAIRSAGTGVSREFYRDLMRKKVLEMESEPGKPNRGSLIREANTVTALVAMAFTYRRMLREQKGKYEIPSVYQVAKATREDLERLGNSAYTEITIPQPQQQRRIS